jgi:hypothetical protein
VETQSKEFFCLCAYFLRKQPSGKLEDSDCLDCGEDCDKAHGAQLGVQQHGAGRKSGFDHRWRVRNRFGDCYAVWKTWRQSGNYGPETTGSGRGCLISGISRCRGTFLPSLESPVS